MDRQVSHREHQTLFRSRASAVLSGDTAATVRAERLICPDHALTHQVFVFALFATCVEVHSGSELDWSGLEDLMEGLGRASPGIAVPEIRDDFDAVVDTARERIRRRLMG